MVTSIIVINKSGNSTSDMFKKRNKRILKGNRPVLIILMGIKSLSITNILILTNDVVLAESGGAKYTAYGDIDRAPEGTMMHHMQLTIAELFTVLFSLSLRITCIPYSLSLPLCFIPLN